MGAGGGRGDHLVHATAGQVYILSGRHDLADVHSAKAMALNPNDIFAMLGRGYVLAYLGDPAAGVEQLTKALRYDPHTSHLFHEQCAEASHLLRDYEKAVDIYKRWQKPSLHAVVLLAMNYAQLGHMDEARAAKQTFDDNCPKDFDFHFYTATHVRMCKHPEDAEHWLKGYRKIGLAVLYQILMIMTPRDGLSDLSARSAWRGDVGPLSLAMGKACATPSERSENPPLRSLLERFAGRQQALEMPHIAGGPLPTRNEPKAIPMSHYHQDLV